MQKLGINNRNYTLQIYYAKLLVLHRPQVAPRPQPDGLDQYARLYSWNINTVLIVYAK